MLNRERESQIQTLLRQKRGYKYGVYWQLFGVFLFFFLLTGNFGVYWQLFGVDHEEYPLQDKKQGLLKSK